MKKFETSTSYRTPKTIITEVEDEEDGIYLDPPYQRGVVWNVQKMNKFIESVMMGIVPNPLVFNISTQQRCIDGKQRITSLCNYKKNVFPVTLDDVNIFFNAIPDEYTQTENCRIMNKDEKNTFLRSNIPCIEYKELCYEDEVDIFHRLQNGMALTQGELMLSILDNSNINSIFSEFCISNVDVLEKFAGDVKRKNHIPIVLNLMYMVNKNVLKVPNKKERESYLKSLNRVNKMKTATTKVSKLIDQYFGDNVMGHRSISKSINKNVLYTLAITYYDRYIKKNKNLTQEGYRKLRSILRKVDRHCQNKHITKSTQTELDNIRKLFITKHRSIYKKNGNITDEEESDDEEDYEEIESENDEEESILLDSNLKNSEQDKKNLDANELLNFVDNMEVISKGKRKKNNEYIRQKHKNIKVSKKKYD